MKQLITKEIKKQYQRAKDYYQNKKEVLKDKARDKYRNYLKKIRI